MLEIIREYSFDVNFETGKFKRTDGSTERIKLVQNDNESTKFKFNFEEEIADNTNVLVRLRQSTGYVKEYTMLIQNQEAEIILANDILSASGSIKMSITLIGTNNEILTAIEYFEKIEVKKCLEGDAEIPEQEKNVLVDLISQVNSLNQTASQLVEESETALQNANTATTNANTATQNANTATSNANQAAESANNAVTEIDNRLANKVDKVNGKDLSTNDYDNAEKEKNETNRTEILRRALITETGNKIELEINNQTYILTAKLYDKNNNLISTSTPIDLPLEAMVVSATYNSETKKVVLTLQSGSTTEFSIADLISGLVNEDTFNETIEELQEENEKLKEKNEELEKEIEELKDNELVYTVSGESIDIDDSANATIRNIKITGKSIQDGTPTPENKNLAWNGWVEDFVGRINNNNLANITTKDGKKCLKFDRTAGHDNIDTKYLFKINWKENTQYTISCKLFTEGTNALACITIVYTDGTILDHRYNRIIDNWTDFSLISEQNKTIKYLKVQYLAGFNYIDLDTFMVEESSIPTTYIPHEEQNITFPLQEGQVLAQDDYLADDGIHHVRKQVVLDGTEECRFFNYDEYKRAIYSYSDIKLTSYNSVIGALSNKFKGVKYQNMNYLEKNTIFLFENKKEITILLKDGMPNIIDMNSWIEYVSQQYENGTPLIIEYLLETPIIEPYTSQQAQAWEQIKALRTYKNITHISSEDETPATLEVTYVRDLQTVINNMQAQILN